MMNSRLHRRVWILAALATVSVLSAPQALGQAFYLVSKAQVHAQTSSTGAVADPFTPFVFSAEAATNATLNLSAGGTQALTFNGSDAYRFEQSFATKAALDAAYPNGTYRLTGSGIPTLSINLATDSYPATTPQVTGGTWNSGGLLVIDPAQGGTINFVTNASYAAGGALSHMSIDINGTNDNVSLKNEIVSAAGVGLPASPSPFTSFAIPAGRLTAGRVYEAELDFDTITTFDTTTVSGGAVVGIFQRALKFYIAAVAAGTTPALPQTPALANQTGAVGGSATFSVTNLSPNAFVIWRLNGQQINFNGNSTKYTFGTTGPGLTINNLTAADAGNYTVTAITTGGIVTSNAATLTLSAPAPVAITRQPIAQTIANNNTVVFSVAATGNPAPTYQWRRDGTNIPGATGSILVLVGNTGNNAAVAGSYTVALTGAPGTATLVSSAATLTTVATADPGRLINLSILTALNAGETLTMGTALGGGGTSGTKALLARAAGPALSQLGVTAFLPDPTMTLNFTGSSPATVVATNNDWAGDTALSTAFSAVGAFGYASANSKDAAIFRSGATALQAGNYTVQVSDSSSTASGTVIAELYDATPSGSFNLSVPRLINVSVLKTISATGSLTAGFFVGGSTAKTVLIRAIGPGLASVGVTSGTMADPQLTLFNSSQVQIAANNDWGGGLQLINTGNRVGAFAVNDPASKDAMLLVTLASGTSYTVQMNPVSGTAGGLAIIEVYEVP